MFYLLDSWRFGVEVLLLFFMVVLRVSLRERISEVTFLFILKV